MDDQRYTGIRSSIFLVALNTRVDCINESITALQVRNVGCVRALENYEEKGNKNQMVLGHRKDFLKKRCTNQEYSVGSAVAW